MEEEGGKERREKGKARKEGNDGVWHDGGAAVCGGVTVAGRWRGEG